MKNIFEIRQLTTKYINDHRALLINYFFLFFLISFFIDRILFSFFINFPFFVVSALLIFPFLFIATQNKSPDKYRLYILIFSFTAITILNSIIYEFGVKNISDLLFIILFITIYFYYKENIVHLKISNVYVLLIISIFLFSFTFFNINADSSKSRIALYSSYFSKSIPTINNTTQTDVNNKKDIVSVDKFKPFKVRHAGLFRRTHMASYFFGFLFLFFSYQYQRKKRVIDAILLIASLGFCFYTGIRSMPTAFFISILIFLFRKKYIYYFATMLTVFVLLIISNDYFLELTKNTFLYQYFYIIHSGTENFTDLARFRLYQSWWTEVSQFGFWNFIIGKSYMSALIANNTNYGSGIWFHNDILNIFYTYGSWGAILYIWLFTKIYRDNRILIRQNIFIFIFYSSMVITSLINGFYYYFPVLLLYPFFLMIKNEKQLVQ